MKKWCRVENFIVQEIIDYNPYEVINPDFHHLFYPCDESVEHLDYYCSNNDKFISKTPSTISNILLNQNRDYYGHKTSLNRWCEKTDWINDYRVLPGITKESFFKDNDYYCGESEVNTYLWSNNIYKSKDYKNTTFVSGACPFAYEVSLNHKCEFKEKYDVVFLPRSDATIKVSEKHITSVFDHLKYNYFDNPLFICLPDDYKNWKLNIFYDDQNLKCVSKNSLLSNWSTNLYQLLLSAKTVYNPLFTSSVVYSSFINKDTKFYDVNEIIYEDSDYCGMFEGEPKYHRSWLSRDNSPKWNEFMLYMKDVFSTDKYPEDKKFFTYKFLSLDFVKSPLELSEDLKLLQGGGEFNITGKNDDSYDYLKQKINEFKDSKPSQKAISYWNNI